MGWLLDLLIDLAWLEFVDRVSRGRPAWVWWAWALSPVIALGFLILALWLWLG